MSTQRYISTSFWDDKWIRSLDPSERYLYMYLLTNTLTTISGIYRITVDRMAYDTGYDERTLAPMLDRFMKAKKAHHFDGEYMILPSWPKHQKWETKSKIRDGIVSCLQDLPKQVVDAAFDDGYLFDLSLIDKTIIARKQRRDISGTTAKALRDKYGNKCANCGSDKELNIHHIKPIKDGGDNSFENLILLCLICHQKEHSPHMVCGKSNESTYEPSYSDSDSDSDSECDTEPPIESAHTRFKKPTLQEVLDYCKERRNTVNAQRFIDYYESKGWKVGREGMKDWKAAVRTWEASEKAKPSPPSYSVTLPDWQKKLSGATDD